jgi:two-component system chemotaxis response regulator CheB
MTAKPVRVMVVEDSLTVQALLRHVIERDSRLEIAGMFATAEEAIEAISRIGPDVISMDIRLPGIDGLEATRRIMAEHPTPIVVIADSVHDSTLNIAMNALKVGALTVVEKPWGPGAAAHETVAEAIATQLFIMSQVSVVRRRPSLTSPPKSSLRLERSAARIGLLGIAASTGGPPALATVLGALPEKTPWPILVVQHMGGAFMEGFASWLATQTRLPVRIASDGERPLPGCVYVAPGDRHLLITRSGALAVEDSPPVMGQKPAANVLFRSLAQFAGSKAAGVLLTGMGEDGASGLLEMRRAGGLTIAEDSSTAVVYGMPGAAMKLGAVKESLPLDAVAVRLQALAREDNT